MAYTVLQARRELGEVSRSWVLFLCGLKTGEGQWVPECQQKGPSYVFLFSQRSGGFLS